MAEGATPLPKVSSVEEAFEASVLGIDCAAAGLDTLVGCVPP